MANINILMICRTCEAFSGLMLVDSAPNLHQMLKTYLNLMPLPQQEAICRKCYDFVLSIHEFDKKSHEVDIKLRSILPYLHVDVKPKVETVEEITERTVTEIANVSLDRVEDADPMPMSPMRLSDDEHFFNLPSSPEDPEAYLPKVRIERILVPKEVEDEYVRTKER